MNHPDEELDRLLEVIVEEEEEEMRRARRQL